MAISYFPSSADAARYRRLRHLGRALNERILQTVPSRAFDEIGEALGVRRNGTLVFETEDVTSVLADSCLYDWYEDGKNVVQQYAEAHPAKPGTDEAYLLAAYCRAKYRLLATQSAVPDSGLYCFDALNREELFLMDQAFSHSLTTEATAVLATRTVPLGPYWMTGGAALPVVSSEELRSAIRQTEKPSTRDIDEGPAPFPTLIIRACLNAGTAEHIVYSGADSMLKERPRIPSPPGSKRRPRLI
jgi:hypothetical protein